MRASPWTVVVAGSIVAAVIYAVWAEAQVDPFAPDVPNVFYPQYEEDLLAMDREALEAAYRAQAQQLFAVWMRDPTGQPSRAKIGINRAKAAYIAALEEVQRREDAFKTMITRPPDWQSPKQ